MTAPRTILLSGATGLVGGRLLPRLLAEGVTVRCLTRDPVRAAGVLPRGAVPVAWDGRHPAAESLAGCDAVVHLAGEPVFGGPLTARRRARILGSRVESTDALVNAVAALPAGERPSTFLCASAVGWYGSRGEEPLDEAAKPGTGFLAEVCRAWEDAARGAERHGVRTVSLRIGIVLAREGGALPMMAVPFRLGVGGPLGDGRQWVPWIHADDLVTILRTCLDDPRASGPINATSPNPVRNADLTAALGRVLGRPTLLRVPAFVLRTLLGELADELLGSRRVVPARARALGVRYARPDLEAALSEELGAKA